MNSVISESSKIHRQLRDQGRLTQLAVSDSGFLFDANSGQSYALNSSASWLLRELIREDDTNEIVQHLAQSFGLDASRASLTVDHFLEQLARYLL